jgi:hypothetical protein
VSTRPAALRVRAWDETFETAETRKLKRLSWLPLPNKQDGDGYCELLDHPDGPAHLAAWTVILQLASKAHQRGWLLRETGAGIIPHDAASIARITRVPAAVLAAAIPRLLLIGWLEAVPVPDASAGIPGDAAGNAGASAGEAVQKGREGKGPEGNGRDETGTAGRHSAPPSADHGGEGTAAAARLRLLTILNRYGATMTMKGKDLTAEWCNAVDSFPLDWIERLFALTRPRPHLPSKLRALLKETGDAYASWYVGWKAQAAPQTDDLPADEAEEPAEDDEPQEAEA